MTTLRIGRIPYLNSVLFYAGLADAAARDGVRVELVPLVPRALSASASRGDVVAGPVPLVTTWDLEPRWQPLDVDGTGDPCIATVERAHSILLFSKRPLRELGGAEVGVTAETSTSVRLMRVLFDACWNVRPARLVPVDREHNDAFLLIGDEALRHRQGVEGFAYVADLGEAWNAWTGLPFVFARWVVRDDVPRDVRVALRRWIDASVASTRARLDAVLAPLGERLRMSVEQMRAYLDAFRFHTGPEERRAIDRFRALDAAARRRDEAAAA